MVARRTFLRRAAATAVGATATVGVLGDAGVVDAPVGRGASALVAGSLLDVADAVPDAMVEAHGSLAVRRLLVDGLRTPDAVAVADPVLLDGLCDSCVLFATNALVLAYDPASPHAGTIRDDWTAAVADSSVRVGGTDPDTDPLGYRTVLALRLAAERGRVSEDAFERIRVSRESSLLGTLELGGIDAAFVYRSMAADHGVPYVDLPPELNFSEPSLADTYASVSYATPSGTVRGGPIRYAATAYTDAGAWMLDRLTDPSHLRRHGFGVPEQYPQRRDA